MSTSFAGLVLRGTAIGVTAGPTRSSSTPGFAVLDEMTLTGTTRGGALLVWFDGSFEIDDGEDFEIAIFCDGVEVAGTRRRLFLDVTGVLGLSGRFVLSNVSHALITGLSTASHTITLQWQVAVGQIVAYDTQRRLTITEVL